MIELDQHISKNTLPIASIKVIGVGGAGGNTVNSIISTCNQSIQFIVANTDAQALEQSHAEIKIQLGIKSTRGLGTGADPELGKRAAEEDIDKIMEAVAGADIVFLTAGMGGGTGSGGLPVIARALKEKGILSIAIVTRPFTFEGKKRERITEAAIGLLQKEVDTLLIIPNQKLLEVVDQGASMIDAFGLINDLLGQSVRGISDIITKAGYINVDFADVRNIMKSQGLAVMGTARAAGKNRAQEAALKAISYPLLENMSIAGAHSVLLNITGGSSLGLQEISTVARIVYEQVDEEAQIIIGSVIDNDMKDDVSVTIIATGFSCRLPEVELSKKTYVPYHSTLSIQPSIPIKSIKTDDCDHNNVSPTKTDSKPQSTISIVTDKSQELSPARNEQNDEDAEIRALLEADQYKMSSDSTLQKATIDIDLDIPTFLREQGSSQEKI
jgi:cell division protein FtsZ